MKYVVITIFLIFSIFSIFSFYFYRADVSGVSFTNKKDSHEFLTLLTKLGIDDYVVRVNNNFVINSYFAKLLMPDYNTLDLRKKMKLYNITNNITNNIGDKIPLVYPFGYELSLIHI